jgi:hypothetical protein
MSRIIPNEQTWIAWTTVRPAVLAAPTEAELDAAIVLTPFIVSLNPSAQGNTVPTPNLDSLFETSVPGTVQASFTGDFYRDDEADTAWETLPRAADGYFFVSRFGGSGVNQKPRAGDGVEVWPLMVVSRTMAAIASNTVQTFTVTGSVPEEPAESAIVTGVAAVPSVPRNLTGAAESATVVVLDWDAPLLGSPTSYKVYQSSTLGGSYTEVTTNITKTGTTARITALVTGTDYFFKVAAVNGTGTGGQTATGVLVHTP